jgi:serine/tyrosine/threonine adenylyltransferase
VQWRFDNTYARDLEGFYAPWQPATVPEPALLVLNDDLAIELGLDPAHLRLPAGVAELAGNAVPLGASPLAQAYAGHQFGQFSPVLGDGRALLLGEVIDATGRRRDVAFKGSGPTPFSRRGDGKAVIGAVLREYLIGEAMHALGVPTTRALAAVATGETIRRERREPGAILTRVAGSHLRVGTFELVRTRGTVEQLRQLADYAINRHYPHLNDPHRNNTADRYRGLLSSVVTAQAQLIAHWMSVGFIHGVMNTDNMTISGETIDYGPCAFMDRYDDQRAFSSIDTGGRYRFANQPPVAAWNLSRFAEALLPLLAEDTDASVEIATTEIERFWTHYEAAWLRLMRAKLGLGEEAADDRRLVDDLLGLMKAARLDFTSTWRALARDLRGDTDAVRGQILDMEAYDAWRERWLVLLEGTDRETAAMRMDQVNPVYIPRNHLVEEALEAAREGDLTSLEALLSVVTDPYDEKSGLTAYASPAPDDFTDSYLTYCGT